MSTELSGNSKTEVNQSRNLQSGGLMLLAVACYSVIPLAVEFAGGSQNPFLFNMGWRGGIAIGFALFLAVGYRDLFFSRRVWGAILHHTKRLELLAVVIAYFDIALFALAVRFVDVSAATVVAEVSPVFLIIIMWLSLRRTATYQRVTFRLLLLVILALFGFAFVVFSQATEISLFARSENWLLLLGILLALSSALLAALNGLSFKWGMDLTSKLPDESLQNHNTDSINLFGVVMAGFIGNLVIVPFSLAIGAGTGETISGKVLMFSVIGGVLTYPIAGIAWRKANLLTYNLGINAIGYIRPILSIVWLLPFSYINVVKVDYLVIGTGFVIAANILINFERDFKEGDGFGLRMLVVALGICGTLVYFREDFFRHFDIEWHWSSGGYFQVLALSATVFTLLLAFRVARLVTRTGEEDNRTFSVFRRLELLTKLQVINNDPRPYMKRIDASRDKVDLKDAYNELRNLIAEANPHNYEERLLLKETEAELDALARSKQMGLVLGEMFAVVIFAFTTVALALLTRPDVEGWPRLLVDVFAILISAIIIFLVVNVRDLQNERADDKLESRVEHDDYSVRFKDTKGSLADQSLSVILGLSVIVTYTILLAYKWL